MRQPVSGPCKIPSPPCKYCGRAIPGPHTYLGRRSVRTGGVAPTPNRRNEMKSVSRIATVSLAAVVLSACGDMELPAGVTDRAFVPMLGIHVGAQGSGVTHV